MILGMLFSVLWFVYYATIGVFALSCSSFKHSLSREGVKGDPNTHRKAFVWFFFCLWTVVGSLNYAWKAWVEDERHRSRSYLREKILMYCIVE
jgi:hypothetical protein